MYLIDSRRGGCKADASGITTNTKIVKSSDTTVNECVLLKKKFSFYRKPVTNNKPYKDITILDAYNYIKGTYAKKQTLLLRCAKSDDEAKNIKKTLFDYCTFSGTFECRKKDAIVSFSGLLCVDFDNLLDVERAFVQLRDNNRFETLFLFRSPSGKGLKWVIQCSYERQSHVEFFNEVCNYVNNAFGLVADPSGKDIGRACFLPFDENVYINPKLLKQ